MKTGTHAVGTEAPTREKNGPKSGSHVSTAESVLTHGSGSPVALFGCGLTAPDGVSMRLDQPCVREHGSIGGWITRGGEELAFTLLWRPLRYFVPRKSRQVAPATPPPASVEEWDALHGRFVDAALASSGRDAARSVIHYRNPCAGPGEHSGTDIALTLRPRRRRLRPAVLRRRQLLWTCPQTSRHLAFEVSVLEGTRLDLDDAFDRLVPTLSCHRS